MATCALLPGQFKRRLIERSSFFPVIPVHCMQRILLEFKGAESGTAEVSQRLTTFTMEKSYA
jgi:hypothetical protein